MKNTHFKKKKIFYALSLCLLAVILSVTAVSVFAEDTTSDGWTFTSDTVSNPLYVKSYFDKLPRAYETVIDVPSGTYSTSSPIISNWPANDSRNCFGFEITKAGYPAIYYYETSYTAETSTLNLIKTHVPFNECNVIGEGKMRLVVVNEIADDAPVYKLYAYKYDSDGNESVFKTQTVTDKTVIHDFDPIYSQSTARELSIGGDGKNYFKGTLYSVAVYQNALTEAEASSTAKANMNAGSTNLMAYYDSSMTGNYDGFIKDQTGNGHDASYPFFERKNALEDYAYSFAFVGDTQFLVYKDITDSTTKYTSPIYDWIVQNKDSKKIQYVLGMGDVTDKNEHTEWEYAVDLHNKLGDAQIPYAVIPGNHDGSNRFNAYFGDVASFTDNIDGKYADSDFQNYYMNFEVENHKYMIIALQYGAPDEVLTWANGVLSANSDRRVIVITHNLFDYEGYWNEAGTREQSTTSNTELNNGIDIWNEFISLHENIIIAAAGHVDPEHIKHHTYEGVNGNAVNTFLIDPQGLDKATSYNTGMVAMFYFSEDGSDVQVEYISTTKTLEAQAADPTADDILFHEINQFSFTTTAAPSYDTEYGNITEGEDNKIVLFKADSSSETGYTFVGGHSTFGDAAKAAGLTGTADTADYVILFRGDYTHSTAFTIEGYTNNVTIDLGGCTVKLNTGSCGFLHLGAVTHADAENPKTITIKNGNFECTASGSGSSSTSVIVLKQSDSSDHYVNCENVSIKSTSPAYPAVSTAGASTSSNTVNAVFTDCVFDFTSAPTACYMFASGSGLTKGKLNAMLVDCKTIATKNTFKLIDAGNATQGFAFYGGYTTDSTSTSNDTLKYKGSNKLLLTAGTDAPTAKQDNLEFVYLTATTYNEIEYDVYEIVEKTAYGNIPPQYVNDKIVVFKADGTFIGGYSTFKDAATAAGLVFPKRTIDCVILFRGDYTHSTAFTIEGYTNNVTIDLGGHTVTLGTASCSFIHLMNITHADTANPETITVKNGSFNFTTTSTGTSVVRLAGTSGTHYVNCENITIKSTATPYVAVSTQGTTTANSIVNTDFTNCVFDYTGAPTKCYMFASGNAGIINAKITDCEIIAASNSAFSLVDNSKNNLQALAYYAGDLKDTIQYEAGNTLLLNEGTGAPTSTEDVEFVYSTTSNGYDIYALKYQGEEPEVETEYGTIGSNYATSPFVVFYKQNGAYVFDMGYDTYKAAMERAIALTKADGTAVTNDVIVLLRTDNLIDTTFPNNMSDIAGTVTLDLGGYTFTAATSMGNTATDDCGTNEKGTINIINGKLLMKSYGIIFSQISGAYDTSKPVKTLEYNFKNITIGFASDASSSALLVNDWKMEGTKNAIFNMNFENCTFDMITNAPSSSKLGIFNCSATSTCGCYNITFKGGSIIADKTSKLAFNVKASKDSITFVPDDNGKYTTVTLPTTASISSVPLNTTGVAFVKSGIDGSNTVYTFASATDINTSYGTILAIYTNTELYPLTVFKTDKTFVGAYENYKAAAEAAGLLSGTNSMVDGADCVILFRRAYTHDTATGSITDFYNNVTIDLGGNTVTASSQHFLALYSGQNLVDSTKGEKFGKITVKNGDLVLSGTNKDVSAVRLDGNKTPKVSVIYTVDFENVKFIVPSGSSVRFAVASTASVTSGKNTLDITCTDCVFDYTNAAQYYMFASGNARVINAKLIGGQILAGTKNGIVNNSTSLTANKYALTYYVSPYDDTLSIEKNSNGEYIKLVLNKDTAAPSTTNVYTTTEGIECVFVKSSETDGNANYSLHPKVMVGYKIKTSVTLYSNFIYNIYIPEQSFNKAMIDGVDATVALVEIDGVNYYHVAVNLPVAKSLDDIKLTVRLNSGNTTVDANWTLSVLNYAKSIVNGSYEEVTNNLVKDMLVYAVSAYTYFDEALGEEKTAETSTLLDGYTKDMPTETTAVNTTSETYFSDVVISLDEVPSFRFYLADGYTAEDFTFKVGTRNVSADVVNDEDGNALYLEITMYAYMMLDTVSYTVTDKTTNTEVTEQYNLYSYYDFAKTLNDANLVSVVEGLIKYSVSAADYRESVIAAD